MLRTSLEQHGWAPELARYFVSTLEHDRLAGRRRRARSTLVSGALWSVGGMGGVAAYHWAFGVWSNHGPLLLGWGIVVYGLLRLLAGISETLRCRWWRFEPRAGHAASAATSGLRDPGLLLDLQNLGLTEDSSTEALQRAYRKLAKVWHPDRFLASDLREHAERRMKLLNASYSRMRRGSGK